MTSDPGIEIEGLKLTLLRQKVAFLAHEQVLLIADMHLGKVNYFRRAGIPVPPPALRENFERLIDVINQTSARRVIFLGDLFHSHYNEEWEMLGQVKRHFGACRFDLVRGNHDIMSNLQYERHHIGVYEQLKLGPLLLTHEPLENGSHPLYNLAGHLHPGVKLVGKGRQSLTLPCFYFGLHYGLLPAFGNFTGMAGLEVKKGDRVFVVMKEKVMELEHG